MTKVYVMALDGSSPHEVAAEFHKRSFAWYPDSKQISFLAYDPDSRKYDWWTAPLDGGRPVKWERSAAVEEQFKTVGITAFGDSAWAPSGQTLYFEGNSRGVLNLWKVKVDPKTYRIVAGPERLTTGAGQDTDLALSSDGKQLAFTIRTTNTRIWSFPFDAATGATTGEGQPFTAAGMDAELPDLTPDGNRLVFVARRAGRTELWEKLLEENGRERLLASDDCYRVIPRWSRDGRRLAYRRDHRLKKESSMVIWPLGGDEQVLTSPRRTSGSENPQDWSADGNWILASSDRKTPKLASILLYPVAAAPSAESQARLVTSDPECSLWQPRFSPDGRWISFVAYDQVTSKSTLNVMPATGGEWIPITDGKYPDDKPRWSPDGKTIYFLSPRTGFFNVWGIRFDPEQGRPVGEPFPVKAFESPERVLLHSNISGAELALSEHRFVLPLTQVSGNIWVLENVDR
jgi:Tol biopolymer transport system component